MNRTFYKQSTTMNSSMTPSSTVSHHPSRIPKKSIIEEPSDFIEYDNDDIDDDVDSLMTLNEPHPSKIAGKIDRNCLKILYPCFKEIGLIRPNTTEKQFCSMSPETLHMDCVQCGITPSVEKMLFPILKGSINKAPSNNKVFEQVPIGKDNGYYFNQERVELEQVSIYICRERRQEIYVKKGSKDWFTVGLQDQYKKSKNSKYKRLVYYNRRIMNRAISWYQLEALIDIPEARTSEHGGLMFDSGLKRWYWSDGDSSGSLRSSLRSSLRGSRKKSPQYSSYDSSYEPPMRSSYGSFHRMSYRLCHEMSHDEYSD